MAESVTVDVIAYYEGVVECPYCGWDNEFLIEADKSKIDYNCQNPDCTECTFEIKIKDK